LDTLRTAIPDLKPEHSRWVALLEKLRREGLNMEAVATYCSQRENVPKDSPKLSSAVQLPARGSSADPSAYSGATPSQQRILDWIKSVFFFMAVNCHCHEKMGSTLAYYTYGSSVFACGIIIPPRESLLTLLKEFEEKMARDGQLAPHRMLFGLNGLLANPDAVKSGPNMAYIELCFALLIFAYAFDKSPVGDVLPEIRSRFAEAMAASGYSTALCTLPVMTQDGVRRHTTHHAPLQVLFRRTWRAGRCLQAGGHGAAGERQFPRHPWQCNTG